MLQISASLVQNWMTSAWRAREMPKLRNTSNFNSHDLKLTIGSLGLKNHWREHVQHSRGNNFPGKKENSHLRGTIWNYERLFLPKPTKYSFTLSTCSSPYTWWTFYCFSFKIFKLWHKVIQILNNFMAKSEFRESPLKANISCSVLSLFPWKLLPAFQKCS